MAVKIVYSDIAKNDLLGIYNFIRRDSLFYAKKEVNDIRTVIKILKANTSRGKVSVDFEGARELLFKHYRIIYDVIPDEEVHIITIHHHSRSISNNPAFTKKL
ncbi:type II toxin-antitoxin system RelE/ParE family toxin [Mucilaginibacter sp. HMF5004]|uniref:type II toxin-antitoxin system RelE/ParE family toxin n=1 Tax=Mucilaginibacter rivuli TaxID=2857527 RepID=UPI001C607B8E|nr:type II toxin-antitoxin system RelE/ParE family toxin [Mucilaginibacter rivuli]MBW4888141.1 type II toxin-antitoxin system RelE/ParE family toxin [Mucilaginibacter rivuli]